VGHGILGHMIWPAPGITADHLAQVLANVNSFSQPILAGVHSGTEVIDKYLRWANDAGTALGPVVRKIDLDRLVYTPRYWATLANPIPTAPVVGAVNQETQGREQDIATACKAAEDLRERWKADPHGTHYIVPDTSVFLNHKADNRPADISTIAWRSVVPARTFAQVRVVVPILVVDELELIKDKRKDDIGKQARRAVNQLFDWFQGAPSTWRILGQPSADSGGVVIELLPDERGHVRLPRNDDELVDRAVAVRDLQPSPVHFLSYDSGAVLRANLVGLKGQRLRDGERLVTGDAVP
jgi:hypothetical protein